MRVLIDTNVIVSAALRDRVPEEVVLFVAAHGDFEWIASPEIITEYVAVLRRPKFLLPEIVVQRWTRLFETLITLVEPDQTVQFGRDQADAKFLACALVADADYFVTGDKDFSGAYKVGRTTILSVSDFERLIVDKWDTPA